MQLDVECDINWIFLLFICLFVVGANPRQADGAAAEY